MATRISLLRSVRHLEQREQIGNMSSDIIDGLLDLEKGCLLHLSLAARKAKQHQIALNSIVRAQKLERNTTFNVCEEFANVLWAHHEQKQAFDFLKDSFEKYPSSDQRPSNAVTLLHQCLVLAKLVRPILSSSASELLMNIIRVNGLLKHHS